MEQSPQTGAAFMTISNEGAQDDILLSVSSPALAEKNELYARTMEGGAVRMRAVPQSVYIRLTGLKKPLLKGESIPLVLRLQKSGEIKVEAHVAPPNAQP